MAALSVQGCLVRPEIMAPDIRNSFVHFAMTELLSKGSLPSMRRLSNTMGTGADSRILVGGENDFLPLVAAIWVSLPLRDHPVTG